MALSPFVVVTPVTRRVHLYPQSGEHKGLGREGGALPYSCDPALGHGIRLLHVVLATAQLSSEGSAERFLHTFLQKNGVSYNIKIKLLYF